ncbi:gephyrin: PROVISIONAL [Gigaspora margarita]|uniref:Gephyrin: PROVISIONAL n=1 Tax=Gigaspora margarita TaxID=4874 RepID=A0A8H3X7U4_GIGMA|nr:gephyrin: PROVISIONAL [Gigaspora margarita]
MRKIGIIRELYQLLQPIVNQFASKYPVELRENYYFVNILTGECTCFDFIWNGPFQDVCKHVHAAHLFNDIEDNKTTLNTIKNDLVQYFHNKECTMPKEQKNLTIYNSSTDAAFEEIL